MSGISIKIADLLKEAREKAGLSESDVAKALKVRASVINKIESGNLSDLPGSFYIYGYIKQYADFLGLDCKELLNELKTARNNVLKDEDFIPYGEPVSYEIKPNNFMIIISMLACFAIYYFWYLDHRKHYEAMYIKMQEKQENIFHLVSKKQPHQE